METMTKVVYAPIVKVQEGEDGALYVYGRVADDSVDLDGQICDREWLRRALPDWYQNWGNIREMHQPWAVGVAQHLDEADDGFYLGARVVDRDAIVKVREGVYKGFSIGIKSPVVRPDPGAPGGRLVGGKIVEVSLVDHPANERCKLILAKAADIEAALAAQAELLKAEWTTAYINDLPDDAFAVVLPGGEKDEEGKTVPRELRKLPHHRADGEVDLPHLRNALARLPQTDMPEEYRERARRHLEEHARELGVGEAGEEAAREEGKAAGAEGAGVAEVGKEAQAGSTPAMEERRHAQLARQVVDGIKELIRLEVEEPEDESYAVQCLAEALQHIMSYLRGELAEASLREAESLSLAATAEVAKAGREFSARNLGALVTMLKTIVQMLDDHPEALREAAAAIYQVAPDAVHSVIALPEGEAAVPEERPAGDGAAEAAVAVAEGGREALLAEVEGLKAALDEVRRELQELARRAAPGKAYLGPAQERPEAGADMRAEMERLARSAYPDVARMAQEWLRQHSQQREETTLTSDRR